MKNKSKLGVIIKEVYRKNVKSASFLVMVFMPIVIMGIIFAIGLFMEKETQGTDNGTIAVVGADESIITTLKSASPSMNFLQSESENSALELLKNNKADGVLKIDKSGTVLSPSFVKKPDSQTIKMSGIESALNDIQLKRAAEEKGITLKDAQNLKNMKVDIRELRATENEDGTLNLKDENDPQSMVKRFLAYIVVIIVFMFIMNYVSVISQEIAAEKGSRIMEIILSSVNAGTHFAGKMLGIGLVILTQIVIYLVLFLVGRQVALKTGLIKNILPPGMDLGSLLSMAGNMVALTAVYAVLGILTYTALAGFVGSLVSRTEDVPKMMMPVTMTALVGFYIGIFAFASPNNILVKVASQIPLFTPLVMPFRSAAGLVSNSSIILSIVISFVFMIICFIVSAVFYKTNVLTYSDSGLIDNFKKSLSLWKSEKNKI